MTKLRISFGWASDVQKPSGFSTVHHLCLELMNEQADWVEWRHSLPALVVEVPPLDATLLFTDRLEQEKLSRRRGDGGLTLWVPAGQFVREGPTIVALPRLCRSVWALAAKRYGWPVPPPSVVVPVGDYTDPISDLSFEVPGLPFRL